MAKTARKYFCGDEWTVVEREFSPEFSKVAESVFSLGNEYMGGRGNLEEETAAPTLCGNYLNGIYEYFPDKSPSAYRGISDKTHFMVNAANYWRLKISAMGQTFDMARSKTLDYERSLSLKNGRLNRCVTWVLDDLHIKMQFCRFLDMEKHNRAYQRVEMIPDKDCELTLSAEMDFCGTYLTKPSRWRQREITDGGIVCDTETSGQSAAVFMDATVDGMHAQEIVKSDRCLKHIFRIKAQAHKKLIFTRLVSVKADKTGGDPAGYAKRELQLQIEEGYEAAAVRNEANWAEFWDKSDIRIEGDGENQQGIRFCIFQLRQTYHGADPMDNIGAKGLTGEAYGGQAFWDTESFCLPYYLFNDPAAAKNLLMYRYRTLPQAKLRARELDCEGACFPIATVNGYESCGLWQHASLQMQPSTAVAFAIFHYVNVTGDTAFLYQEGVEMLAEICRYLASRGQWSPDGSYFGYYCVMGPDEFQMMVNHNCYTNYMAKKTFAYTMSVIEASQNKEKLLARLHLTQEELWDWKRCAEHMLILYDEKTKLFEQHDGFFRLPHVEVKDIPAEEFPLYRYWSYDRIYRNDMIKQPDVLMFMFLYSGDFTLEEKRANYEYYEPRCIHESSLSPSVHSILAAEIGKEDEALKFFGFASRLDLDDYNRNTAEGLHTTSIAAAWMNIVYGFGGLRSDGKKLILNPTIPAIWKSYTFKLKYRGSVIEVTVKKGEATIAVTGGEIEAVVCGEEVLLAGTREFEIEKGQGKRSDEI